MSRWGNLRQNAIRGNANNLRTSAARQSALRQDQIGASFRPQNIPGCMLDLDSNYGVTTVSRDGFDYVSAWADQTGNTDVVQATEANQPIYNGVGGGLTFDGGGYLLQTNVTLSMLRYLHSECTVFIALDRTDTSTLQYLFATSLPFGSQVGVMVQSFTGTEDIRMTVSNGTTFAYYSTNSPEGSYGSGKYVFSFNFDSSSLLIRTNGEQVGSDLEISGSLATTTDPSDQLRIGGYGPGNRSFGGTIYQVLAYDRKLTDSEIALVEAYLSSRWDIPL